MSWIGIFEIITLRVPFPLFCGLSSTADASVDQQLTGVVCRRMFITNIHRKHCDCDGDGGVCVLQHLLVVFPVPARKSSQRTQQVES